MATANSDLQEEVEFLRKPDVLRSQTSFVYTLASLTNKSVSVMMNI